MKLKLLSISLILVGLSACGSQPTQCPLNNKDGYCSSVDETYKASVTRGGSKENVLDYKRLEAAGVGDPNLPVITPPRRALGSQALDGPVFIPAHPYRYWVAPWTDANGVAHSGEMQYFVIPGRFAYGSLETPGAASGILGPVKPEDLGFTPVQTTDDMDTVRPSKRLVR